MAKPKRPPVVLLVIAALLVFGIGAGLWRYSRFNSVHAVNGLSVDVDVTLAGKTRTVAAGKRTVFDDVPVGTHEIVAKLQGEELESTLVFVKGGGYDLVYNIGGAAPVVWERIAYSKFNSNQQPQWDMYCGRRFVVLDGIDYVFVDPPRSISTKGGGTIYKTHLTVDSGGLAACQSWALDKGTQDMWADWYRLEARIDPKKVAYAVEEYSRQGDLREAQTLIEAELARRPSTWVHDVYLLLLVTSGQQEKARAKYFHPVDDERATDEDLFRSALMLPRSEKLGFIDQALVRFPQSSLLLYARGVALDRLGDSAQALSAFELAEGKPPPNFEWKLAQGHIAALLRLKRYSEAWAAGQSAFKDSTGIEGAVSYANLATVTGNPIAGWDAKLKAHQRRWAEAQLGLQSFEADVLKKDKDADPESFQRGRELIRAALQPVSAQAPKGRPASPTAPPAAALAAAAHASDSVLRLVPDNIVWLLLTEAWRTGNTAAAARLSRHAAGYDSPRVDDALRFIATGQLSAQLELASDLQLAVLWLARGRRLAALGEDPKAAFDEARRLDAFHSVVWRALESWPLPEEDASRVWVPIQ